MLENEINRALQFLLHAGKDLGRSQQHGRMHVMTAGMADARRLAGKGKPGFLLHGKGIHVRPETHGTAGFGSAKNAYDGSFRRPDDFNIAEGAQHIGHISACVVFLEGKFRILVEMMPPFHHISGDGRHIGLLRTRRGQAAAKKRHEPIRLFHGLNRRIVVFYSDNSSTFPFHENVPSYDGLFKVTSPWGMLW